MYAFPRIRFPAGLVAAAEAAGKAPDAFFALAVLDETGIIMVPGSGFGQQQGTWHFRTTFLPPEEELESVMERLATVHSSILRRYGGLDDKEL